MFMSTHVCPVECNNTKRSQSRRKASQHNDNENNKLPMRFELAARRPRLWYISEKVSQNLHACKVSTCKEPTKATQNIGISRILALPCFTLPSYIPLSSHIPWVEVGKGDGASIITPIKPL